MADGTAKHSTTKSDYEAQSYLNDALVNTSDRNITNQVDAKVFNASAFYTKKFKKKGRTFSWNVSDAYNESNAKGNLYSKVDYFDNSGVQNGTPQITDQYKTNEITSNALTSNMTYTEPLSKSFSVILNYGLGIDNSSADRKSFNNTGGQYTMLDSTYSNNYQLNQLSNQGGAILNYQRKKITFNFGTKVTDVSFKQTNEYTQDVYKRNFINWSPQANFRYKISQMSGFSVNYSGKATQPTVDQIQPVRVNTDQLNEFVGNPGLTPSFTSRINANYNSYKVLADQYVFFYGDYSFTTNPIVNNTVTTALAHSTTQYVNLNRTPYNFYYGLDFGRKIGGIGIGLSLNGNGNKNYNISNGDVNIITANTYSAQLRVQKYVEKKYDFNLSFGPSLTYSGSSLQSGNNNGHGYTGRGGFSFYLPWKLTVSSDGDYQYNSKTETFNQDYSRFLWNARLEKSFDKEEKFKVALICNDILNQNSGFERTSSGVLITQDRYTTIKRYFMVSVIWNFNKVGGAVEKK
jgi:hypothetical protein